MHLASLRHSKVRKWISMLVALVILYKKRSILYSIINRWLIDPTIRLGYPLFYEDVHESIEKSKPEFVELVPNALRTSFKKVLGVDTTSSFGWWDRMTSSIFINLDHYVVHIEDQMKSEINQLLEESKDTMTLACIRGVQNYCHLHADHHQVLNYALSNSFHCSLRHMAEDMLQSILQQVKIEIHMQNIKIIHSLKSKLPQWVPKQLKAILPGEVIEPPAYLPQSTLDSLVKYVQELEASILLQIHSQVDKEVNKTEQMLFSITEKRLRETMTKKLAWFRIDMLQ